MQALELLQLEKKYVMGQSYVAIIELHLSEGIGK